MSAAAATPVLAATGRRKTAVARVRLTEGSGTITINGRPFEEYLPTLQLQNTVLAPLQTVNSVNRFDLNVVVKGGGTNAQASAIRLGIARALTISDGELRKELKPHGFLRRDPRMKERKKAGRPGARKRFQFSKR
ncbi:small subunit ribosomal protein S9 [Haloferula luteola]|uniref:Small ribosomal subunit protein uS9 n=1 Tax=Haloferula luteola TaxID=595692 RepID=A0A840V5Z0_9BACT|nr:30S ribosomal protein S9 [Haloferula luteola]MBB5352446.1 small subunit ribosomal protein S9 [Haloferula luteola]